MSTPEVTPAELEPLWLCCRLTSCDRMFNASESYWGQPLPSHARRYCSLKCRASAELGRQLARERVERQERPTRVALAYQRLNGPASPGRAGGSRAS